MPKVVLAIFRSVSDLAILSEEAFSGYEFLTVEVRAGDTTWAIVNQIMDVMDANGLGTIINGPSKRSKSV